MIIFANDLCRHSHLKDEDYWRSLAKHHPATAPYDKDEHWNQQSYLRKPFHLKRKSRPMSYAEERLAEIRAAKALKRVKRPMSKFAHTIRSRLKAQMQLESLREKEIRAKRVMDPAAQATGQ